MIFDMAYRTRQAQPVPRLRASLLPLMCPCSECRVSIRAIDNVLIHGEWTWTVRLSIRWRRSGYLLLMTPSIYLWASLTLLSIPPPRLLWLLSVKHTPVTCLLAPVNDTLTPLTNAENSG